MYKIQKVEPIETETKVDSKVSKFPFDQLEPGEGFFVPNIEKMPPAEIKEQASTLRNMQTHCNARNKQPKHSGKVFKAAYVPNSDRCWIQVWRVS